MGDTCAFKKHCPRQKIIYLVSTKLCMCSKNMLIFTILEFWDDDELSLCGLVSHESRANLELRQTLNLRLPHQGADTPAGSRRQAPGFGRSGCGLTKVWVDSGAGF